MCFPSQLTPTARFWQIPICLGLHLTPESPEHTCKHSKRSCRQWRTWWSCNPASASSWKHCGSWWHSKQFQWTSTKNVSNGPTKHNSTLSAPRVSKASTFLQVHTLILRKQGQLVFLWWFPFAKNKSQESGPYYCIRELNIWVILWIKDPILVSFSILRIVLHITILSNESDEWYEECVILLWTPDPVVGLKLSASLLRKQSRSS